MTPNITSYFEYDNEHLDTPINDVWNDTTNAIQFDKFLHLKRNNITKQLTHNNLIDWKKVLKIFNTKIHQNTNFEQSKLHAFKTHILFNELPTIKHLSHKNVDLYRNVKCPTCGIKDEDQLHLWQCSCRSTAINNIKNNFIAIIIEQCKAINKSKIIDSTHLTSLILNFGFNNIIQGLIPNSIDKYLKDFINLKQRNKIIELAMDTMYEQLYNLIWKQRCNDMNELEEKLGITKDMKKQYKVLNRTNTDNNHNTSHSTWEIWISTAIKQGGQWMDF
jgi:hypothetical protein